MDGRKNVIVIGGGISGLSAGKLLLEQYGLDVLVLEARDRVGGRTHTVRDPSYGYTDVGGAYIGPTQRRVARMASELGLEFYCVNEKEKTIMDYSGTWMSFYGFVPPILNPIKAFDLNNIQQKINKLSKEVPAEAPWKAPRAEEWDSMTVQEFIDKNCWTTITRNATSIMCRALLCQEPREVSLLFFLWYISSGQGLMRMLTITNGGQERKFVGGASRLSERMADKLGDRVVLNEPVIRIEQTDDGVSVHTATGKTYQADHVISAVPQTLLNRITFVPPLPPLKIQLIQRIPMGSIIKTMMFYETAFWKEKGFCGQMSSDYGPVLYCMDDTKPDGSHPCIMGFILANRARDMCNMTEGKKKKVPTATLR